MQMPHLLERQSCGPLGRLEADPEGSLHPDVERSEAGYSLTWADPLFCQTYCYLLHQPEHD